MARRANRRAPPVSAVGIRACLHPPDPGAGPGDRAAGSAQIGKTTLLTQVVDQMIQDGVDPRRLFRLQFDDLGEMKTLRMPIVELVEWYTREVLGETLNKAASERRAPYLFLDEVQNLADWAPQLKHLVDLGKVRAMVTGSSALRIEAGNDSLAGRVQTIEMGPLLLREIAALRGFGELAPQLAPNGLAPLKDKAFWHELGGMAKLIGSPGTARSRHSTSEGPIPWPRFSRRSRRQNWRISSTRPSFGGRSPTTSGWDRGVRNVMSTSWRRCSAWPVATSASRHPRRCTSKRSDWRCTQTSAGSASWLTSSSSTAPLDPTDRAARAALKRRRGASKLCLCDPMLRAAWLQEVIPLDPEGLAASPHLYDLAGHIAESVVGYFFRSIIGLDVAHFPERQAEPEVDFILTVGEQRIPVEVKYRRRIDHRDTLGLRSFIEKAHYNAPFGVLVTMTDSPATDDSRIVSLPLPSLLLMR